MPFGRVQGFEPLSALPRTLELEDPMIPEKQHVINCVRVAYFQIIVWEPLAMELPVLLQTVFPRKLESTKITVQWSNRTMTLLMPC